MCQTEGTNSNSLFIDIYLATFNISQVKVPFQIIGKNISRINKHSNATYRSGTVNSNMVNSKFRLIRSKFNWYLIPSGCNSNH